jgi:ribose/xylose/arabinose/galactoside ABC-type transport system permease subunit
VTPEVIKMSKDKVNMMEEKGLEPDRRHLTGRHIIKSVYVYAILVLVILVLSLLKGEMFQRGNFLFWDNITNVLRLSVPILIISGGFTLIMISGNIDLSVGSILSLTTVFYAILALNGFGFLTAALLTLALGVVLGFINGWLVMKMRITPVIATLITMNVYQGVARYLVPEGISSIKSDGVLKMPDWMGDFARAEVIKGTGLSWALIMAIVIIVALVIVQRYTVLGKYVAAVGGNRTAAELSGINAVKVVWGVYVLLGALSALAGVARGSYMTIGEPYTGVGTETQAIIAVLLGGTAFTGGEGSVVKSVIGALIIACLTLGLKSVIAPYWQSLATGVVLVLAVALNHVLSKEKLAAQ